MLLSLSGGSCTWDTICSTSGAVILTDAAYSEAAVWQGFVSPSSPIRTGNASSSRSLCVQLCPIIGGIKTFAIAHSNGSSRSSVSVCPAMF